MSIYGSLNGVAKKATKLYAPVNGVAKEVTKLYGSENGVARVVFQKNTGVDYIEVVFDVVAGNIKLANKWNSSIEYSLDGGSLTTLGSSSVATITPQAGSVLRVYEGLKNSTFRDWSSIKSGFIWSDNSSASARITAMPPMHRFTTDADGHIAGEYFFYLFNGVSGSGYYGIISSLPVGSFDISNITTTNNAFFAGFNSHGKLTSLPIGSFNTSNITTVSGTFFSGFNGTSSTTVGYLTKNNSNHTNTVNKTSAAITAWYKTSSGSTSASIAAGSNFNWNMS